MLKLTARDYHAIRCQGEETYPDECCGILLGKVDNDIRIVYQAVRCANACIDSPQTRYEIDPLELIRAQREARARGLDVVGFYHSHADHPALWSPTDLEEAHWIGCSYLITSVEKGSAQLTKSFVLTGTIEENKMLLEEELEVSN